MVDWIGTNIESLWWVAGLSVAALVGTIIAVPILITHIPTDYFSHSSRQRTLWADQHPLVRWSLLVLKNVLGLLLIVMGIAMLVLPGQGILTIVVGMLLVNFPGKYRLERWIVSRRHVLRAINWVRRRAGQAEIDPLRDEQTGT